MSENTNTKTPGMSFMKAKWAILGRTPASERSRVERLLNLIEKGYTVDDIDLAFLDFAMLFEKEYLTLYPEAVAGETKR
jgi:hypothetical protein